MQQMNTFWSIVIHIGTVALVMGTGICIAEIAFFMRDVIMNIRDRINNVKELLSSKKELAERWARLLRAEDENVKICQENRELKNELARRRRNEFGDERS